MFYYTKNFLLKKNTTFFYFRPSKLIENSHFCEKTNIYSKTKEFCKVFDINFGFTYLEI